MSGPAITLLIPCRDAEDFLPRLIDSVRSGTQQFTTVLCYDDGSRDDTVGVARRLGLEIITGQPHRGVAHARNQLATAARTEWIHFHDADDLVGTRYLERLQPACDDRHDVVSCDADWLDEADRSTILRWRYDPEQMALAPLPHLLLHPLSLNNSIIRRSSWQSVGGCDESLEMWEDADVHIRLARSGARFHHIPEVLTCALRRTTSFSHDYHRSWICRLQSLERYAAAPGADQLTAELAHEVERAAAELAFFNDRANAERAISLCRRLGVQLPTTSHPFLNLLKSFVPAYPLLRLQVRRRRAAG